MNFNDSPLIKNRDSAAGLLCLLVVIFFIWFLLNPIFKSLANDDLPSVRISEIMYDLDGSDDGREWVEIFNFSQSETYDLLNWKFEENGIKHQLSDSEGGMKLPPGVFAVIADNPDLFRQDYPDFLGILINSSFSLSNTGETFLLRIGEDGEPSVDEISYDKSWGGSGNGKSIGLISDLWKETEPTPGAKNTLVQSQESIYPSSDNDGKNISFTSPVSVFAGKEFSVTVNLSNFDIGSFALKILIGQDGKFIYGNTKGSSGWLTQNGKWAEMPQVSVGVSGSIKKEIFSKVDDDAKSGNYFITVSVAEKKDGGTYESVWSTKDLPSKTLKVTAVSVSSENTSGINTDSNSIAETVDDKGGPIILASVGEVLGEQDISREGGLNFYVILGVFGLLTGIFGLVVFKKLANERKEFDRENVRDIAKNKGKGLKPGNKVLRSHKKRKEDKGNHQRNRARPKNLRHLNSNRLNQRH